MEIEEARKKVRDTGLILLKEGLVARTWGNISCRVDNDRFVISPSGLFYEYIREEHIPLVHKDTLRWEGEFRPSSEKELHARLYRENPRIGAIVHTHQPAASSAAAARIGLDSDTPCVPYALPTTSLLARKTALAAKKISLGSRGSLLLSNHGAVCCAPLMEEAVEEAMNLEVRAREVVDNAYASLRRKTLPRSLNPLLIAAYGDARHYREEREQRILYSRDGRDLPGPVREIFSLYPSVETVIHSRRPYTRAYSDTGLTLRPLLDDMAQIIGINAPVLNGRTGSGIRKKKNRAAFFIPKDGAYCLGKDGEDARAVQAVLEKSSRCAIESEILGGGYVISLPERILMRRMYLRKYALLGPSLQST